MKLQVEATTNGAEAIAAWEKYGPGHFHAAMFDHRTTYGYLTLFVSNSLGFLDMPICDGVEASRRIRALEAERGNDIRLPSELVVFLWRWRSYSPFCSHRLERRLPGVHETIVLEFRNGRLPFETGKQD